MTLPTVAESKHVINRSQAQTAGTMRIKASVAIGTFALARTYQPRRTPIISFVGFFVPLRQVVGNVVPWSFRSNKHVKFWFHTGVVIERPQWEAQPLWTAIDYSD